MKSGRFEIFPGKYISDPLTPFLKSILIPNEAYIIWLGKIDILIWDMLGFQYLDITSAWFGLGHFKFIDTVYVHVNEN